LEATLEASSAAGLSALKATILAINLNKLELQDNVSKILLLE
jgi:hypothetical protein